MKLVKIPFEKGGLNKTKGVKDAPDKIVSLLENQFSNEDGFEPCFDISEISLNPINLNASHLQIEDFISKINQKFIALGGDHSLTYSIIKGLAKTHQNFKLIVLDAHPDLMEDFIPPTHESYLRALLDQDIILPEDIIILGIRNWDQQEISFLKEKNISFFTMKDIFKQGIPQILEKLSFGKPIYLSIDIDVVDPVEAIGTGYSDHGGLSSRELIHLIQELKKTNHLLAADLVEVNPSKDINDLTSSLAAKLIMELS